MKTIALNFSNMHKFGDSFYQYLCLRKRHFVDNLNWNIPHDTIAEMDQYDTPQATYILIQRQGEIVAGARLLDFDSNFGSHTCMVNDFFITQQIRNNRKLGDLVCDDKPLWEGTRLVISDELTDVHSRNVCLQMVILGIENFIFNNGGGHLLTVSSPVLLRKIKQFGYQAEQVSPPFECIEDGKKYAILSLAFGGLPMWERTVVSKGSLFNLVNEVDAINPH